MDIIKIVKEYLSSNGYDGLCEPDYECGCELKDLMPCGQPYPGCMAGYKFTAKPETGYDFVISPFKEPPDNAVEEK
jgi:hypothetical protein